MNKVMPILLLAAATLIALRSFDGPATTVFNGDVVIKVYAIAFRPALHGEADADSSHDCCARREGDAG